MSRITGWIATIILTTAALLIAPPATAATLTCYYNSTSTAYTETWQPSPIKAGRRVCYDRTTEMGWRHSPGLHKYVHPSGTRIVPNMGGAKGTWPRTVADRARRMASEHGPGAVVQFARVDLLGRGCFWNNTPSGTYATGGGDGRGLIRLGNSGRASCNGDIDAVFDVLVHELGHAEMEQLCPAGWDGPRAHDVSSVLGYLTYRYTVREYGARIVRHPDWADADFWHARRVMNGNCG